MNQTAFFFISETLTRRKRRQPHISNVHQGPSSEQVYFQSSRQRTGEIFSTAEMRCPYCNDVVPQDSLKQHFSQCHSFEMPFGCSLCGKGFQTSSGLNNHMQAHEGRKFMCPICDFKFKQKGHLKQHLKSIHKLAQCPTCSETFSLGDEFNQHVLHCM